MAPAGTHWDREEVPGAEDLCVLWSLNQDVLSHHGHTCSRVFGDFDGSVPLSLEALATAHGEAMGDRRDATGIEYSGDDLAWAHRMHYPMNSVLEVWGPCILSLKVRRPNSRLTTPAGQEVEADLIHRDGVVELELRIRDKKSRRQARQQALSHGEAARHAGVLVRDIEVWDLLDGLIETLGA